MSVKARNNLNLNAVFIFAETCFPRSWGPFVWPAVWNGGCEIAILALKWDVTFRSQ